MKKKTGNGTTNRQLVYILGNVPFVTVVKVGITGNMQARLASIDKSAPGTDHVLFKTSLWGAYYWEQLVHFIMAPFRIYPFRALGGMKLAAYLMVGLLTLCLPMFLDWPPVFGALLFSQWFIASCLPWGSGRTERFLFPAAIFALVVFLIAKGLEKVALVIFVLFLIWLLCGAPNPFNYVK